MKNIVSFETAKKLEIAGFERPAPEIGQFWYDNNKRALCISSINRGYVFARHTHDQSSPLLMIVFEDFKECVYAPTATDIFEQLPDEYILSKKSNE